MAEPPSPAGEPPAEDSTPPRTRTGEIIREGRKAAGFFASLKPEQVLVLGCGFAMVFICAMYAYQMEGVRRDQTAERAERRDAAAAGLRETNAQAELLRQHCAAEGASLRAYFAEREKERNRHDLDLDQTRRRFEAEQAEKWRQTIQTSAGEFQKWRDLIAPLLKKLSAADGPGPVTGPGQPAGP